MLTGEDHAILHRDASAEFFYARDSFWGRVFEVGERDPLSGERRLAVNLFNDSEHLPRGIVLRRMQMKVVTRFGE